MSRSHQGSHAPSRVKLAIASLCAALSAHGYAQTSPQVQAEIIVTANPLGGPDSPLPAERIEGLTLKLRAPQSLGEALSGLAGVSASNFGPAASRPVVRGLDGDRVRVLRNGAASLDASALSPDHAVPLNLLSVEAIEVVRGPAALLYGGNAIGGVVNVLDGRIHSRSPFTATQGAQTAGAIDTQWASGDASRAAAAVLDVGNRNWVLHADAATRRASDTRVPVELPCTAPGANPGAKRICNSASRNDDAALGLSVFAGDARLGFSHSRNQSNYGAVAEDEVTIGMRQSRQEAKAELALKSGPWQTLKAHATRSNYSHTEFEAGSPGTVFSTRGNEVRAEALQREQTLGAWRWSGVSGVQQDSTDFSADGAEAFAPYTRTHQRALFALQQLAGPVGQFSFGAHQQSVQVDSMGHPSLAKFAPQQRRFTPLNTAVGWVLPIDTRWQVSANLARAQRAPKDVELYADGPHIATAAYEVGDASLGLERARHTEVGIKFKTAVFRAQLQVFNTRYNNHITFNPSGNTRGTDGEMNPIDLDGDGVADASGEGILPEWQARAVSARFTGFEAQGEWHFAPTWRAAWRIDQVRATNSGTAEPLSRIAPRRLGLTLHHVRGSSSFQLGFDRHAAQTRVPTGALTTAGFTLWSAAATHRFDISSSKAVAFVKLDNANNALAYSASSILTQTVPGKNPLPGRSLRGGLQIEF